MRTIVTIAILTLLLSCEEQIVEKYNTSQEYNLDISISGPEGMSTVPDGEKNGKLELVTSDGAVLDYDIVNGNNLIDVPFGFYKAYVKAFHKCSVDDFELAATGGNKKISKQLYIGIVPQFSVEITGFEIQYDKFITLQVKPDTVAGEQYRFYTWGTNSLDHLSTDVTLIHSRHQYIPEDGIIDVWAGDTEKDEIFRYYNVTAGAFYGQEAEIKYNEWYELILE